MGWAIDRAKLPSNIVIHTSVAFGVGRAVPPNFRDLPPGLVLRKRHCCLLDQPLGLVLRVCQSGLLDYSKQWKHPKLLGRSNVDHMLGDQIA